MKTVLCGPEKSATRRKGSVFIREWCEGNVCLLKRADHLQVNSRLYIVFVVLLLKFHMLVLTVPFTSIPSLLKYSLPLASVAAFVIPIIYVPVNIPKQGLSM